MSLFSSKRSSDRLYSSKPYSSKSAVLRLHPLIAAMQRQPHMLVPVLGTTFLTALSMSAQALASSESNPAVQAQTLDTIVVSASQLKDYDRPLNLSAYGTEEWLKVPAAVNVIGEDWIETQQAHSLADVIRQDAAMGENYAPIGYYANVVSRGMALDYGSSFLINGQLVRGEQNIALENKQQVELLKGISAVHSGMATPGGVINYVTKRAEEVGQVSLHVDEYGDTRTALDVGGFVGEQQQFGYRVNLANQQIRPYVEHADGDRQFGSLALDWEINDRTKLLFDIEGQRQEQRSVPGYQLMDGKVPSGVKWDRLLGNIGQAYPPVTMRSLNSQLQLQYQFNPDWSGALIASTSRVKNNDNSAFAFGCYSPVCQAGSGIFGFDAQGNYDIYNYQIPKDQYATDQYKANLNGSFATGSIQHHLMFELAQTQKNRKLYEGINELIGTGNIYTDEVNITLPLNMHAKVNEYKALDSSMTSLNLLDRIEWNQQWSTLLGGKWVSLNEKAFNTEKKLSRKTDIDRFLPQVAIMYAPQAHAQYYLSYSEGLSDGMMAPWYSANGLEILAPIQSQQYELGVKYQLQNYILSAAIFQLEKDHQGPQPIIPTKEGAPNSIFVNQGQQINRGVELGLDGHVTDALRLKSSVAYTHARLKDTGVASQQGHQVQNVPSVRFSAYADYDIAAVDGLSVLGGLRYSSSKYAHRDAIAKVSGFTVVDVGAAYAFNLAGYDSTVRLNVDNLFNKKYWRDAGGYLGDDYLFLGEPRTAKLGMEINF